MNVRYLHLLAAPCYRPACQLQFGVEENVYAKCIMNVILGYGNGANFATLDLFGRLLLNTYFQTIVFFTAKVLI